MSPLFGIALAIISALCWGGLDALRKKLAHHLAVLTSALILEEYPSERQLIGIGIIVSGALSLGWTGNRAGHRGWHEPGVWMMVAVSLCWAATLTFDKLALNHAAVPMHALMQSMLMGINLWIILAIRGSLDQLKKISKHKKLYLWAVITSCLATGTQLMAITTVQVGVVEAIKRSLGLALSVLSGWIFFKEPPTLMKQISVLWMGIGVLIVVL